MALDHGAILVSIQDFIHGSDSTRLLLSWAKYVCHCFYHGIDSKTFVPGNYLLRTDQARFGAIFSKSMPQKKLFRCLRAGINETEVDKKMGRGAY